MYINSLIPPITQNFARKPILKSNICATRQLYRDIYINSTQHPCDTHAHKRLGGGGSHTVLHTVGAVLSDLSLYIYALPARFRS